MRARALCSWYRQQYPTHQSHGWRANMLGNDVVRIEPDDPLARAGLYYIGVLGVKECVPV